MRILTEAYARMADPPLNFSVAEVASPHFCANVNLEAFDVAAALADDAAAAGSLWLVGLGVIFYLCISAVALVYYSLPRKHAARGEASPGDTHVSLTLTLAQWTISSAPLLLLMYISASLAAAEVQVHIYRHIGSATIDVRRRERAGSHNSTCAECQRKPLRWARSCSSSCNSSRSARPRRRTKLFLLSSRMSTGASPSGYSR